MNIHYHMPVELIQGRGCVRQSAAVFKKLGSKAFIVTGRGSAKKNGSLDDVTAALSEAGISYAVFDEIMSNPTIEIVYRGAARMREEGADFIVAIGGGSPMDSAKAIALLYSQDIEEGRIFSGQYQNCLPPMAMVPTTAGTGSEVTQYAILTNDKAQTKTSVSSPFLFADVAFLDGRYMEELGRRTTIHTAVDALSHCVEGMISKRSNTLTDLMAKEGARLISESFCILSKEEPIPLETRDQLLYASTLGGMVIAQTGTTVVHSMGYGLTYFKDVDHGRANGLLIAEFLRQAKMRIPDRIEEILEAMGMRSVDEFSGAISNLLGEKERLTEEEIRVYADIAAKAKNMKNAMFELTRGELEDIYRKSVGAKAL